jgi:bis(5'-nucleosyl)-tetraphosphatase (symmetrical)
MARYAIGDIQGCCDELKALLAQFNYSADRDQLWFVGDLVNRGPKSLETLRFVRALGANATVVLGNHDLHLLALVAGVAEPARKDTLGNVLAAPDRAELCDWLRRQPLLHTESVDGRPHVLVHAGLPPGWSVAKAANLADELHAALAGPDWRNAAEAVKRWKPEHWDDRLTGGKRLAAIAAALTRLRVVDQRGGMELDFKGPPQEAPKGTVPWFAAEGRQSTDHVVVCGHWAALGLLLHDDVVACDSGCVWGGQLTAVKLAAKTADRAVLQEWNAEGK